MLKLQKVLCTLLFMGAVLCTAADAQNKLHRGRLLGIDPDGKIKFVLSNGKSQVLNFDVKKISIVLQEGDKSSKKGVFDLTVGDSLKLYSTDSNVVRIVYEKPKETVQDFLFKNQKVKMMKGRFKQLDTNNMKLYLYDEPEMVITPYTKYIPHYGEFVSKDTVIVGYVDGMEEGVKIAKWVRLKERK